MRIKKITLENFRNYGRLECNVEPSVNILYGQNAQGKTNVMEAIYLCACARSHRTHKDKDLIQKGSNYYRVHLDLESEKYGRVVDESVALSYEEDGKSGFKRIAYYNDLPLERFRDYIGIFHAVIFAPEDMQLVKEGPSVRRRFIDLMISQVKPSYFHSLNRYARLLSQRNKVIKEIKKTNSEKSLSIDQETALDIWSHPLAEEGANIIVDRICYTERIKNIAVKKHGQISEEKESLSMRYKTIPGVDVESMIESPQVFKNDIKETFLKRLTMSRRDDLEKGMTGYGPHRDDLEIYLDGENMRNYASQGQQRSATLSLKIAEMTILREDTGENPILLLDDVFSELDSKRRACLLENIEKAQVFITCTDKNITEKMFKDKESDKDMRISYYEVDNGSVKAITQDLVV